MFASGFLFAVMGLATKATALPAAGRTLPASEVAFVRFAFGFLVLLPLRGRSGVNLLGNDRRGLFLRGIYGGLAVCFYFLSLQQTSLTHAQLLNYTSLIFAPMFAAFFLREHIRRSTSLAIAVALIGTLLIMNPQAGRLNLGDLYALISGIMAGAATTEVRRLRRTETAWSVFFYLSVVGAPISLALMAAFHQQPVWPAATGWLLLAAMAVASVGGQLLMTFGYKYVRAAEGTLITMTQLCYNAIASVLLFGEAFGPMTAVGGLLLLGAAVWMGLRRS